MALSSSTSRWVACCPRTLLGPGSFDGAQRWDGLTTSYSGYVHHRQQGLSLVSRTSKASAVACRLLKQHRNSDRVPDLRSAQPGKQQRRVPMGWLVALSLGVLMFLGGPAQAAGAASDGFSLGGLLKGAISFLLHLDVHLSQIIAQHGAAPTYAILWAIVFCETGLVITPFLPGDSLLFAAGAFASLGHLNLAALMAVFISSAILGDAVNYQLGSLWGTRAKNSQLVKKEYLEKTEAFYLKHGGKAVVLSRFIPIIRTFAPFVAGVGTMPYKKFAAYNVGGAILWTVLFVGAGALLGNLPAVKHNFSIVVFGIVGVSLLPIVVEAAAAQREAKLKAASAEGKEVGKRVAEPNGGCA